MGEIETIEWDRLLRRGVERRRSRFRRNDKVIELLGNHRRDLRRHRVSPGRRLLIEASNMTDRKVSIGVYVPVLP
jgi:hypothetical protein